MTAVPTIRKHVDTDMHTGTPPCEHKDRHWGETPKSHGMPKTDSKRPEARREAWNIHSPSQPSEGPNTTKTLILDLGPPRTVRQ